MLSFDNFIEKERVSQDLLSNPDAKEVFSFLSSAKAVANLIIFSQLNLPVLSGIAAELEIKFAEAKKFPLTDQYNRTIVGRMVKYILRFYGYVPSKDQSDRRLRKFSRANLFASATIYNKEIKPEKEIKFESICIENK